MEKRCRDTPTGGPHRLVQHGPQGSLEGDASQGGAEVGQRPFPVLRVEELRVLEPCPQHALVARLHPSTACRSGVSVLICIFIMCVFNVYIHLHSRHRPTRSQRQFGLWIGAPSRRRISLPNLQDEAEVDSASLTLRSCSPTLVNVAASKRGCLCSLR